MIKTKIYSTPGSMDTLPQTPICFRHVADPCRNALRRVRWLEENSEGGKKKMVTVRPSDWLGRKKKRRERR